MQSVHVLLKNFSCISFIKISYLIKSTVRLSVNGMGIESQLTLFNFSQYDCDKNIQTCV